jgi:hypothetical protein
MRWHRTSFAALILVVWATLDMACAGDEERLGPMSR